MEEYSQGKIHKSEPKPGNENVNTVYFVIQAGEILESVARRLFTMNEHAILQLLTYVWASCLENVRKKYTFTNKLLRLSNTT